MNHTFAKVDTNVLAVDVNALAAAVMIQITVELIQLEQQQ
jgi:hypothetical protein